MKTFLNRSISTLALSSIFVFSSQVFADGPPPMPVKTLVIEKTNVPLSYEYPARLASSSSIEIHARVSGIIEEKLFTDGELVKKGDLLFRIDPKPYQAIVDKAKAQVMTEQARLRQAEREKNRVEGLYREKAVSEQERDNAISAFELAQAGLAGAKAALNEAQLNLDYTEVRAPISGLVGTDYQKAGDLVGRDYGRTHLTTITQLSPIEAHFAIGEKEYVERLQQINQGVLKYTQGDKPSVSLSHVGMDFAGEIKFADHVVDIETGSIKQRAIFENPEHFLLPGAFVRVKLEGIEAQNVIQIPQSAVLQIGSQAFAYVIQDGKAQLLPLDLQRAVGNSWLINGGIEPGDQLILNNLAKLRPDTPVTALPAENSEVKE